MKIDIIYNEDCIGGMKRLPDKSIDMILCDMPYGRTACKWDKIIPIEPMWKQLKRVIKPNGAIVLTASQPFTTILIASNMKMFKYCWVWNKVTAKGHLVAKIRPMQQTEDIIVFGKGKVNYFPVMTERKKLKKTREGNRNTNYSSPSTSGKSHGFEKIYTQFYPKTLLTFKTERGLHPTQKPVALMEYFIKTYTNKGNIVLDFAIGSGTTAVACINLNRYYVGFDTSEKYCKMAEARIVAASNQLKFPFRK